MHPDLTACFNRLIERLKADLRCKGGWHYGSVGRGLADEYSDYDPVYLVADKDFEAFAADVRRHLEPVCDELLISWAENYNGPRFKNFCNLLRINGNLHQLDYFIANADYPEDWWVRQHLKGCTRENIIFDRSGEVGELLDRGLGTDDYLADPLRCVETYWFHVTMLIKYFLRGDIFKLIKNIDMIFHAHVDLLLSGYDHLDHGAWETRVRVCVPEERQKHLLEYFSAPTLENYAAAMQRAMAGFHEDAQTICEEKGMDYPNNVAFQVMENFKKKAGSPKSGSLSV